MRGRSEGEDGEEEEREEGRVSPSHELILVLLIPQPTGERLYILVSNDFT